jgi:hypothetical protein
MKDMVGPSTHVDEWARSYVATADDRLNAVHDYLSYRDMKGLGEMPTLTKSQVSILGGAGALVGLAAYYAIPSFQYRLEYVDMKKALVALGIGAVLAGGTAGGLYAWQRSNDPFAGE